jgi:hypothetical protein
MLPVPIYLHVVLLAILLMYWCVFLPFTAFYLHTAAGATAATSTNLTALCAQGSQNKFYILFLFATCRCEA